MWIEVKPRTAKKETLFIFKFTSRDDFQVFMKMLQLYASASSAHDIKLCMTQFAALIERRADDKYAYSKAQLTACIFADEMAAFTECLTRLCFEYEMARIRDYAVNNTTLPKQEKAADDMEYLKKEAVYLDQIRLLTETLAAERNAVSKRQAYDEGVKHMVSGKQTVFITENGKTAPSYVVMSMDEYNRLTGKS